MIQKTIIDYLCNLININTTIDSNNEIEGILYIKEVFDKIGIENRKNRDDQERRKNGS